MCTADGVLFDNASIIPHVMQHKADPVTGAAMTSRDVIALNMDRDESTGRWQCPVLNKPFTDRTKVVAIRQRPPGNEANVISYEAYHELNIKAKSNVDLISGKKFGKDDVIVLNDPKNEELCRLRDINNFYHIKRQREENTQQHTSSAINHSVTASRIMEKLDREKRKREQALGDQTRKLIAMDTEDTPGTNEKGVPIYTDELVTSVHLTSGKASGCLTSTTMNVTRENKARLATEEEIINSQCEQLKHLKKKGMVRMFTSKGAMDIEVHCDIVPRTAMNFLLLATKGEYNGSKFHRSIANFMIQGGKKPGSKKNDGGSSIWGKPFADEFDDRLTHTGSGVVSMANTGPGTNGRQFFITYKSCAHLDRKHTIFGQVVGGLDILRKLEHVPTEKGTDRPVETVLIEGMDVLENPVTEALERERKRIQAKKEKKRDMAQERRAPVVARLSGSPGVPSAAGAADKGAQKSELPPVTVGKYLHKVKRERKRAKKNGDGDKSTGENLSRLPPPPKKTTFGDFSAW